MTKQDANRNARIKQKIEKEIQEMVDELEAQARVLKVSAAWNDTGKNGFRRDISMGC